MQWKSENKRKSLHLYTKALICPNRTRNTRKRLLFPFQAGCNARISSKGVSRCQQLSNKLLSLCSLLHPEIKKPASLYYLKRPRFSLVREIELWITLSLGARFWWLAHSLGKINILGSVPCLSLLIRIERVRTSMLRRLIGCRVRRRWNEKRLKKDSLVGRLTFQSLPTSNQDLVAIYAPYENVPDSIEYLCWSRGGVFYLIIGM